MSASADEYRAEADKLAAAITKARKQQRSKDRRKDALLDTRALCLKAQELQVRRKHYIRMRNRLTNAIGALTRRYLGWDKDAPNAEAIRSQAAKIVSSFMKSGTLPPDAPDLGDLSTDLNRTRAMLAIADEEEGEIVLDMESVARRLPAYAFVKSVDGFGDLGFAVLIGEAGNLSNYPNNPEKPKVKGPDALRKRLGLAPYNGQAGSNWKKKGGLTADQWIEFGYKATRRAEVYSVIEDPLFRAQTVANGPYRSIYDRRRAHTAITHPEWSKGQSHGDAKRIMVQRLIDDLWNAWRQAIGAVPDKAIVNLLASTPNGFTVEDASACDRVPSGQVHPA